MSDDVRSRAAGGRDVETSASRHSAPMMPPEMADDDEAATLRYEYEANATSDAESELNTPAAMPSDTPTTDDDDIV